MARLPSRGLKLPCTEFARYNCEAYALGLDSWSVKALGQTFTSDEDARTWVLENVDEVVPAAAGGANATVYFWYPTPTSPNSYHWAREVTGCDEYLFAAKLGRSDGIWLYKTMDDLKAHVAKVYNIPVTTNPIFFALDEN